LVNLIPCAVGSYMVEHIAAQVFMLLFHNLHTAMQQGIVSSEQFLLFLVAQCVVFLAVSGLIWFFFARNATAMNRSPALQRRLLALSLVTLCVVLVLSSVRDQFAAESDHLMVITRLFSIFSCLFLLYIRYDILEKGHLEAEHAQLRSILAAERKQFEQSRGNIELINIKCHDMRHKLEVLERRGGQVDTEEFAEIRRMIDIYDSHIHTGNEILDTILTEWSLFCEKEGIRLSCIADGKKLGFLSTGDICALFGNAIENAIEAVSHLPDPEERSIRFQVRENRGMLVITVENNYTGAVTLEDGLPRSTKGDNQNHGFGMKSIRNVAEKYGGELSVVAEDTFCLTVLIPIPAQV
ncbi:MAG: sensor histidine kinase, partial [Oscillospiraceae bacterium]|nr:sensor histidine kinase [Oscillospiraceae bacterium]